jgi:predicted transcriptional regulator
MLKQTLDKISISVPNNKKDLQPIARLAKLAEENDRSVSFLAVEAIFEYLEQEEKEI